MSPFNLSLLKSVLGQAEAALDLLDEALEQRDFLLWVAPWSGDYDPVREMPRFRSLVKRLGL